MNSPVSKRIAGSDTFCLRTVTDADHEFLVELHNDDLVLKNLTHPQKITLDDHMRWWQRKNVIAQRVYSSLGFHVEGRMVESLFRDGKHYDQIMMYMLKQAWETNDDVA